MIFSVVIGHTGKTETKKYNNTLSIEKDEYGNSFICNKVNYQKVRLGKNVKESLEAKYEGDNISAYEIPKNTFFSNNNKTMNLVLMNFWSKDKIVMENHECENLMYITIDVNDYKLLKYDSRGNEIIQTFRKKDINQGCAITFKNIGNDVFKVYALNKTTNKYELITIHVDEDMKVTATYDDVKDKSTFNTLRFITKKYSNKLVHFKIHTNKLMTNTYFVSPELSEVVDDMIPENSTMVVISQDDLTSDDAEKKESLKEIMNEVIIKNRVRAITLVGLNVNFDFCREYNILYLFSLDHATGKIRCLKSN